MEKTHLMQRKQIAKPVIKNNNKKVIITGGRGKLGNDAEAILNHKSKKDARTSLLRCTVWLNIELWISRVPAANRRR